MSRSFSVIIVTWNALQHLKKFLPSVTNSEYDDFEILIADNASSDGSAAWIEKMYPECRVIRLEKNYGYCGGNNRAAIHARGEILVFLNNDVEVEKNWLTHLNSAFNDPLAAVAQPKIRSAADRNLFEYAGASGGYLDSMAYPFCMGRIFHTVETDDGQYDDPVRIFWASGAAFAVRNRIFKTSGGFDEDFNFHMEEIDLCWRLLNRGYQVVSSPDSIVYHLGGGSLPMGSSRKTYFNFRNSLMMIWKNASSGWLRRKFLLRLCLDGLAGLYAGTQGKIPDVRAIVRAHLHFYSRWKKVHAKRKQLQLERTNHRDPAEMIRTVIIADYFLRGKTTFKEVAEKADIGKHVRKR